jgi:hypothetical protein
MNKSKKSTKKTIIVMFIFLIVIVISYYFIRTSTKPLFKMGTDNDTEYEKLLAKDIKNNYPFSPREVIKLYSRITKCLYNQDLKDEEIDKLSEVLLVLLDDELLINNPKDTFLIDLKSEITTYRKASRTIINYTVQSNADINYWEKNEQSLSSVVSSISLKEGSDYTKVYQKYILRNENDGQWKILGWEPTKEIDLNEND